MLNQLLKFTLVSSLLLWLRPRWKGLLALGVSVVLVHVIHGEYLGYVELSGDRSLLVWSYVLKWVVLLFTVLVYLLFVLYGARNTTPGAPGRRKLQLPEPGAAPVDDGFDFLRHKKGLRSEADLVISRHAPENGKGRG